MEGGIKKWPEDERPREKMRKQGAAGLTNAELLALIIRTGDTATRKSAIDLGREVIARFGDNLRELASADLAEICTIKGMGPAKATGIKAAFTLAARFQGRRLEHLDRFTSPKQVFDYFHHEFRDAARNTSWPCCWTARTASSAASRSQKAASIKVSFIRVRCSARRSRNRPPP